MENITTKTTKLMGNMYGCRVSYKGTLVCETRVMKHQVSSAFKDMLRMLDKLGYDSDMASASRHRDNHMPLVNSKVIWY
jgi:hypothetical protein